jgi:hypothetical protein
MPEARRRRHDHQEKRTMDAPAGQAPQDANTGNGDQGGATGAPSTEANNTNQGAPGAPVGNQGTHQGDQGAAPSTGDQGQASNADAERVEDLPEWAQRIIRTTRAEAAENRTNRTAAEQALDQIRRAIDPNADGDQGQAPGAEELTGQLAAEREARRAQAAELVLYRTAGDLGVDPGAVADSRSFERALAELDPTAADFADKVKAAATASAAANPRLKASPGPSASSTGRFGGRPTPTEETDPRKLAALIANKSHNN